MAISSVFGRKMSGGDRMLLGRKAHGSRVFGRKAVSYGRKLAMTGMRGALPLIGGAVGSSLGGPMGGAAGAAIGSRIAGDLR